jgi:hypothetical protein
MDPTGNAKEASTAVLISTPGLKFQQTIGNGPIRCTYTQSNVNISYIVSGNELYQISGALAAPRLIPGKLLTSLGAVQMSDNGSQLMIVDGRYGYYVEMGDNPAVIQITSDNFHPTDTISFQDGYFICVDKGTGNFFLSDLYSAAFQPLNETNASGSSDILIAAISNNRQLYLLGAKSLEIWYNSGASAATPFSRQDGRFSQIGCAAPASIAVLGETFFWLGSNSQGGGIVYTLDNAMPTRVSNHAIEYALQNYGDLTDATAYAYQSEGHYFYMLNIPSANTTWCYDVTVGQWHERQSTTEGNTDRHIGETHCLLNGTHIVGDFRNGNIYKYDLDTYTDNGQTVQRIRQTPHISYTLNRIFYKLFEVDMQFGVGLNIDTADKEGGNPRIALQMSNDGGSTWGNPIYASIGKIGQFKQRARWQRLGSSRDRVFRVIITEPVRCTILSAMIDLDIGTQ